MFALAPWKESAALLTRGKPPFGWLAEEFPTLYERLFAGWPVPEIPEWPVGWGVTTEELEKEIVVRMEMPGFEPAELKVEVTDERLTVEAEHKEPAEKGEKAKEKVERAYAHVKRVMTLPPEIEPEKAEAILRNGVLEVHVPRKPEAVARRIEVKP